MTNRGRGAIEGDRPGKPGLVERLKRSIHSSGPEPRPAQVVVDMTEGKVVGYVLSSGRYVRADEECCADPLNCTECWKPWPNAPLPPPWWWR